MGAAQLLIIIHCTKTSLSLSCSIANPLFSVKETEKSSFFPLFIPTKSRPRKIFSRGLLLFLHKSFNGGNQDVSRHHPVLRSKTVRKVIAVDHLGVGRELVVPFPDQNLNLITADEIKLEAFINGKLLDSLIIGIIAFVCCNLFKFPYAALIAVIIGVTNIIPFFGPFIGAIPSAFLILLVDPMKFLYFCLFVFLLQQFDGNILGPKILGESTGLASFWVLFSILLFGGLFGFPGMVLGVPCFAIFYSIVTRLVNRGLRKKDLPQDTGEYMGMTGRFSDQPSPLEDLPEEPQSPAEPEKPEPPAKEEPPETSEP